MKTRVTFKQRQAETKHILYSNLPSISTKYPNVASIEIKIRFTDNDDGNKSEKNITYQPDSKACFQYDCPYRECIDGGYDFKNAIENAMQSTEQQSQEKLLCQGWQDKERINKNKCLLEALVSVKIIRITNL